MKKVMNKFSFAAVALIASASSAFAAKADYSGLCNLIKELGGLLVTLRIMAFIGAGFIIAKWAWEFISAGKVELSKVQEKGIGLLVGFVLLFAIGAVLTFLMGAAGEGGSLGCASSAFKDW